VVSARTGLPQDVLRAWERRYEAVIPHRTETGRRLYTDRDLDKLRLLKRAVDSGRQISDVADRSVEELRELVREDVTEAVSAPAPGRRAPGSALEPGHYVDSALSAIEELDGGELDRILRQASVDLSRPSLRNEVVGPLLETIGQRWRQGTLRVANEHLASAVIRSFLDALRLNTQSPPGGPTAVFAAPTGQRHELGALLAAIAAAARQRNARVVALSVVCPANDPKVGEELGELRRLLDKSTALIVGGAAAGSYDAVLEAIGARRIEDPQLFQDALEKL
jgi:DNA-binding transcriptional MerR regulator